MPGKATDIWSSGDFTNDTVRHTMGFCIQSSPKLHGCADRPADITCTGKVVRYGPNKISFNSATALKDIYGFKANVRKADFYDAFAHPVHNTHNTRDKVEHARKRRVLSHAFSDSAIKEVERYVLANIRTFCQQIGASNNGVDGGAAERKGWSTPKNMTDWCNYLAMDILGDLAYGKAFHMLEKPDNRYAIEMVGMAAQRHLMVSSGSPADAEAASSTALCIQSSLTEAPSAVQCPSSTSLASTSISSTRLPPAAPASWSTAGAS